MISSKIVNIFAAKILTKLRKIYTKMEFFKEKPPKREKVNIMSKK